MKFSKAECTEIYYAVEFYGSGGLHSTKPLLKKIGVDGKNMLDVTSHENFFTREEAQKVYFSVMKKREEMLEGTYDDTPGEVEKRGSETYVWSAQLGRILAKLSKQYKVPS